MMLKFKYKKTRRLFRLTILSSIFFILVLVGLLIITKAYLPIELIKNCEVGKFLNAYGYIGLFLITFLGGTVLPLGSPAAVSIAGFLGMAKIPVILVATAGSTLGILVNYFLAYKLGAEYVKKKVSPEVYEDVILWWNRWGVLLVITFALFPILPFDLIALICGIFRFNLGYFILINFLSNLINNYIFLYFGMQAGLWIGLI